jgi:hypothetical protein
LEFWQFPTIWTIAVDDEVAFKELKETGVLPPHFQTIADTLVANYKDTIHSRTWTINTTDIFSSSNTCGIDGILGRKKLCAKPVNAKNIVSFLLRSLQHGHRDITELLLESVAAVKFWDAYIEPTRSNNRAAIDWLLANGFPGAPNVIAEAAFAGNVELLDLYISHNFMPTVVPIASDGRNWIDVLWTYAASEGHLEILKRLHTIWGADRVSFVRVLQHAVQHNHLSVVEWVYSIIPEAGQRARLDIIIAEATRHNNNAILQWALRQLN